MVRADSANHPEHQSDGYRPWEALEQELGELVWETDSRLRYEHALFECAQALMTTPDDSALRRALEALLAATDATHVFLERNVMDVELGMCSEALEEVSADGVGGSGREYWTRVPWSRMPTSRSFLERGEVFAFNIRDLASPELDLYRDDPDPVVSELDIPIFVQGHWAGLVGFAERAIERAWSQADIRLLEIAAALIGAYWEREQAEQVLRRSLEEKDRRVRYERALSQCSAALLKSEADNALEVALSSLLEATEASSVFVERNVEHPDLGLCTSMVLEASRPGMQVSDMWNLVPWSRMPISYRHLSRGEIFAFLMKDLTGIEAETYANSPGKSELDIPIFIGSEWKGLVGFSDRVTEREWGADEIEFLRTAAEMIAAFWERRAAYERLEQLVRAKDDFVASVSHELRTPLTVVVGLASELRDGAGLFSPEEAGEFIRLIADQATEVANIVEDLLVIARADIHKVTIFPEPVDLVEHLRSVYESVGARHPVPIAGNAPRAMADPSRLRQILRNLLTNAIRHGGDAVRVELGTIGDRVRLEVCDNGEGVREGDSEKIFDAYHRAHDRKGRPGSVGLGLTVSRRLAHLMDGDLTYSRREGWSVFALSLPIASKRK